MLNRVIYVFVHSDLRIVAVHPCFAILVRTLSGHLRCGEEGVNRLEMKSIRRGTLLSADRVDFDDGVFSDTCDNCRHVIPPVVFRSYRLSQR